MLVLSNVPTPTAITKTSCCGGHQLCESRHALHRRLQIKCGTFGPVSDRAVRGSLSTVRDRQRLASALLLTRPCPWKRLSTDKHHRLGADMERGEVPGVIVASNPVSKMEDGPLSP